MSDPHASPDAPGVLVLEWFSRPVLGRSRPVVCTGVFDLLHVGHVRFLRAARQTGGALVVGVEDDRRVAFRKGPARPLVTAVERAELLSAIAAVDGTFLVHGPEGLWAPEAYAGLLAPLSPSALAMTAGDPAEAGKRRAARLLGIDLVCMPAVAYRSTTGLITRAQLTADDQTLAAGSADRRSEAQGLGTTEDAPITTAAPSIRVDPCGSTANSGEQGWPCDLSSDDADDPRPRTLPKARRAQTNGW